MCCPLEVWDCVLGEKRFYGLAELPTVAELEGIAEKWKPYRTVGTWYIWQGLKLPSNG